jgi:glyceraldehyde 3-phosphate dehydrogenase
LKQSTKLLKKAAETNFKGIVEYTDDPIVSIDVIGNSHSCVFDAKMTSIWGRWLKS